MKFFRITNSWGTLRDPRAYVPGYHDLAMEYLDGPIAWCPSVETKNASSCRGKVVPLENAVPPPGY